jgi:2-oxoisovalerate dehydrogenase E1 component
MTTVDSPLTVAAAALEDELARTVAQAAPLLQAELLRGLRGIVAEHPRRLGLAALDEVERRSLEALRRWLPRVSGGLDQPLEVYPRRSAGAIAEHFTERLVADLRAGFARARLRASLTAAEKREALLGMLRTRHLDARLKRLFGGSEVRLPDGTPFQGKGFRSMGQEAIYAAGLRLRRGEAWRRGEGPRGWQGDLVTPMIRDLGLALAMGVRAADVMAAQMGKVGKPTDGKDLHIGDFDLGVLPPSAPITLSAGSACGLGFALRGSGRVVVSPIGEGGTSGGEWHEMVNFSAVRGMPIVWIVQNNQTALSTPVAEQSRAFDFAQKAIGYGLRATTVDGTDPEAVFAAVTEAAEACRRGEGPVMVELVAMRMCGHAHHDDMLYLGAEPEQFLEYVREPAGGYVDRAAYAYFVERDPIARYAAQLVEEETLDAAQVRELRAAAQDEVEAAAREVVAAAWPAPRLAGHPTTPGGPWLAHREPLAEPPAAASWKPAEPPGVAFDRDGKTFWQAITEALAEELRRDPDVFVLGEDVGGSYGNAFLILKPLLGEFGDRLVNTPLGEAGIIGCATGAALAGRRPVAEIQFNDFVAPGFNQLVNNAAKIHYRWGGRVPLTVRMPWGGLRSAGPYHSQNTEAWFYRTPGLQIVCPSTPREAKGLLKAAIRSDAPVLFYEHIALYRAAGIKQRLPGADEDLLVPIGPAHLKRDGGDLTIVTYGAFVHRCLEVAERLQREDGVAAQVLDLRTLLPLDREAVLACARRTGRVLVAVEDTRTGSIGESVAALVAEQAFAFLDAPVRVVGSLDTPVPYSPPLEAEFLPSQERILEAARRLAAW